MKDTGQYLSMGLSEFRSLEELLFSMLNTETDVKLCSHIQDTLVYMLQALGASNLTYWLQLCKDVLTATTEEYVIETSPVELFVNLLIYNRILFESVQIDIQSVDFSVTGSLEYNNVKYEHQHVSTFNNLYQSLVQKFNQDYEKYQ
ncbi:unnamed protein product [Rotaria sp. Silwood2]|nr:unnamed protein product [Rotaria sp. Silwood2]CAF3201014.1 unnamed protein product [Rotaria sp. Silwood2]CAF3315622.1 unnamed protein product [Rotaria sp. Silwood2]CAF4074595.1 unnamed protein product [Rotaria sp. Silwood2]CAF4106209.1 unnamed protein product [Rotaria sp. Silwood2]